MLQKDRQVNLIDYVPADKVNGDDAHTVISKDLEAKRLAYELKLQKKEEKIAAKKREADEKKKKEEEVKVGIGNKK